MDSASADKENGAVDSPGQLDAGALFVLKSRGSWLHCGYHLTTSIVGPVIFSFPFALSLLGWAPGLVITALQALLTFYSYNLLSLVLEYHAHLGKRQLRFRDMAADILGPRWGKYFVGPLQIAICYGAVISCILLGGQSLKVVHLLAVQSKWEDATVPVYNHLRNCTTNVGTDTILPFAETYQPCLSTPYPCLLRIGRRRFNTHRNAPNKDYSIQGSKENRILGAINGISIIATTYGCGIIPEIQATIAPPARGKMFKGLCICFGVIVITYFSVAISGYWAFGNQSQPTILYNFMSETRILLPTWFLLLTNIFTLVQLVAVTVVYLQPTNEIFEKWFANPRMDEFSARNVMPRLVLRSVSVIIATVFAAMLPFFGDIMALFGAFGIIPLDFILPMLLYNLTFKPSRKGILFWGNTLIAVASSALVAMGALASVRQIVLDAKTYHLFANM
ncbi:hypothetical protein V6N12_062230 [Hibiscus sabdariffa]|uniref:Amino acid transporter transmembrane domain-containing protein n=1 Tax=Hibiscus sabdariffa TaxID=183260 RepID=A0ABR2F884_9ROSI